MTAVKEYTCKTCEGPGEYERPAPGDYVSMGSFRHLGTDPGHKFEPKPQCPKCKSFAYRHYETNWGHGDRCDDCGHDHYFSLGD